MQRQKKVGREILISVTYILIKVQEELMRPPMAASVFNPQLIIQHTQ